MIEPADVRVHQLGPAELGDVDGAAEQRVADLGRGRDEPAERVDVEDDRPGMGRVGFGDRALDHVRHPFVDRAADRDHDDGRARFGESGHARRKSSGKEAEQRDEPADGHGPCYCPPPGKVTPLAGGGQPAAASSSVAICRTTFPSARPFICGMMTFISAA